MTDSSVGSGGDYDEEFDIQKDDERPLNLTKDVIHKLRDTPIAGLDELDQYACSAFGFFFDNDFQKAEEMFRNKCDLDPVCAVGYGFISLFQALMSFEKADRKEAMRRLKRAYKLSVALLPSQSTMGYVASLVRSPKALTSAQLRAKVVKGESEILCGLLLMLAEKTTCHIKGGLAMHRGYQEFEQLEKLQRTESLPPPIAAGLKHGLGMVNSVLSMVPPGLMSVANMMGYQHDARKGIEYLLEVVRQGGVRSPIASAFLLIVQGIMPSFATVMVKSNIGPAKTLIEEVRLKYPNSAVHLWLTGRVLRLERRVSDSIEIFKQNSASSALAIPQVRHLGLYEEAWSHCLTFDFLRAAQCFNQLQKESSWSKAFYCYAQAACFEFEGQLELAMMMYNEAPSYVNRKIAGKLLSVEQYLVRKVGAVQKFGKNTAFPIIELMLLFNLFPQTPLENLPRVVKAAKDCLSKAQFVYPDEKAVLQLMCAVALRELGEFGEARKIFEVLKDLDTPLVEYWIQPYALYEYAVLEFYNGRKAQGEELLYVLTNQFQGDDFNFRVNLQWRVQLTRRQIDLGM